MVSINYRLYTERRNTQIIRLGDTKGTLLEAGVRYLPPIPARVVSRVILRYLVLLLYSRLLFFVRRVRSIVVLPLLPTYSRGLVRYFRRTRYIRQTT